MDHPKSSAARAWSWVGCIIAVLFLISFTGCVSTGKPSFLSRVGSFFGSAGARFNADVAQAEAWAQTPTGTAILNDVAIGVNAYVASTGGGPKSTANAQALSAAVRSLETGRAPDIEAVSAAISNYVPNGTTKQVLSAIVASATTAPTVNGGLEVAAKTIDQAAAPTSS